jgi:tRNA threonylcarbamoyladenosine biosynthesis protein TsaE
MMGKKLIRDWKKVYLSDLSYIVFELKEQTRPPCMVLVEGVLGAGKTTFIKQFVGDQATSPTYSILHDYTTILHADFYRLKDSDELYTLELASQLEDKQYFMVEWGEKYIRRLVKELPESFQVYFLDIEINKLANHEEMASRNFSLSSWTED